MKINNFFNFIFRIAQPQFLGLFIAFFMPNQTNMNKEHALCFAAGTILCSFLPVLVFHPFFLYVLNIGQRIRIACCSLLYHKVQYNFILCINKFYWGNTKFSLQSMSWKHQICFYGKSIRIKLPFLNSNKNLHANIFSLHFS